jgi:hypothetical protein
VLGFGALGTDGPGGVNGDGVIRGKALGSEIAITTTSRMGGAIQSLTWAGKEFIDAADHGRELQSAWNGDAGVDPIQGETFNPTEAGSRDDGAGPRSSSVLLKFAAHGNTLDSESLPAFWLEPGERSGGNLARNTSIVSKRRLVRHVVIGYKDFPNVIDYHVSITIPAEEHNHECVIEALTGYMPPDFSRFEEFDAKTGQLVAVPDEPKGDNRPVVFSTPDGSHAMGAISPVDRPPAIQTGPTYSHWRFVPERVVKWNAVYMLRDPKGISGTYRYHVFVIVGTRKDVLSTMTKLVGD